MPPTMVACARSASPPHVHVGSAPNTKGVIAFVWMTPLTVYANVPWVASENVSVADPT